MQIRFHIIEFVDADSFFPHVCALCLGAGIIFDATAGDIEDVGLGVYQIKLLDRYRR